jgi:fucose 4-O-acetylase-like acetyltransferase
MAFLDWTRGFAALIMLQGHTFHSFAHKDLRGEGPYVLSQFIGGITANVFLFLTGVTLAFLMDSSARKALDGRRRITVVLQRAGFLLVIAYLFRLQMWAFAAGKSPWTDLFKVDILNSMALAVAVLAPLALFTTRERVRFGAITGLAIACASPIVSAIGWTNLHPFVRAWFVPDANHFAFFPYAAFVAFGLAAGSILRLAEDAEMHRVMQWAALSGVALIAGGRFFGNFPYSIYPASDFWLNSPALTFIKTGVILLLASFAFLWTRHVNPHGWSFVRQLGTTSLLVYWVHTELVYGSLLWKFKENLSIPETALLAGLVIVSMIGLSVARTGWKTFPGLPVLLRCRWQAWRTLPAPQPAGD